MSAKANAANDRPTLGTQSTFTSNGLLSHSSDSADAEKNGGHQPEQTNTWRGTFNVRNYNWTRMRRMTMLKSVYHSPNLDSEVLILIQQVLYLPDHHCDHSIHHQLRGDRQV